jgi:AcrR family transcriptional regulator
VGISKTAFYKHFESKEDLMIAALEQQNDWLQQTFRDMIRQRGGPAPVDQLYAVFDVVEHILDSEGFQGCIFVNAAIEFPLSHEPAHVLASQNKAEIEEILHALAIAANAPAPRALAQELCMVMEGAYVTRHITGKKDTIDIARRIVKHLIRSGCPAAACGQNQA